MAKDYVVCGEYCSRFTNMFGYTSAGSLSKGSSTSIVNMETRNSEDSLVLRILLSRWATYAGNIYQVVCVH